MLREQFADYIPFWHQIIVLVHKYKNKFINTLWMFHFLEGHFPAAQGITEIFFTWNRENT